MIARKEKELNRKCGKVFLDCNQNHEYFIFARFNCRVKDYLIVTIQSYIPCVGFVTAN
jgi:hypothetical protein